MPVPSPGDYHPKTRPKCMKNSMAETFGSVKPNRTERQANKEMQRKQVTLM
jgi:hypothetical protein